MHINIPAGNLPQAVFAFYQQTGIEVLYLSTDGVRDVKTHAVVGEFEPAEALARMLQGTGFRFEFEHADSVLLHDERASSSFEQGGTAEDALFSEAQRTAEVDQQREEEIVVTGSFIRGLDAITAPLVLVATKEKKQAAYGTVQDVLRTLPQNFGGGSSEDFSSSSPNFTRGSSINLRGLGTGATLVLINGRRQPVSGIDGDFVDVSTIPWSAVERIEVLPDGASALYGSDAIAGVVNIIMREDLPGPAETQARFGVAPGGADETLVAQFFGHRWDSGKWLLAYQYSERTALAAAERSYAASADKRPLGGSDLRSFFSNPANILDPTTREPAFAIPPGQDGRSLSPDDLLPGVVNLQNQLEWRDLLPDRTTHNIFFTGSQRIGERFELLTEGRYSHRRMAATERGHMLPLVVPSTNPFFVDPFGGSPFVVVAYNFLDDFGPVYSTGETETYTGTLGMQATLGDQWKATLSGYYGKESMRWRGYNLVDFVALVTKLAEPNPATTFNPFGSGSNTNPATLDAIRFIQRERAVSQVKTINLIADGPLPGLPAGNPKLAVGLDSRRESLNRDLTYSQYERRTDAAFIELAVPLASRLDLSLAARHETYDDFGDTFNPKIGLRWAPTDSLRFRGSWGSSFRAPTLVDLYDRSQDGAAMFLLADPHSASGHSTVLLQQGTNASLHEENASTWTAGIDFSSSAVPGLTLTSTYYVIDYKDRIWRPHAPVTLESLIADDEWTSLVTRNPSRSQVEAICNSPVFFGSPSDCLASSRTVILDVRVRNLSATTVRGVDLELQQALQTNYGSFSFGLNGGYVLSYEQAVTRAAPTVDLAGVVFNPPKLRLRGTADWYQHGRSQPGFGASLAVDYLDSSRDKESSLIQHIDSLATFDLQLNYRTAKGDAWRGDIEVTLNAVNVFNQNPPFLNREEGYDPTNAKPFGRVISFMVKKNWGRQ